MAEIKLTLEETLKIKESIEWGYNYYTEELNQLGYTHQVKDNNELEVYDENGNFVGKSFLGKEGQTSTRKFEAAMEVPEQVAELSNQLLLIKISLGYSERDIALLQQENLVQEPEAKYGSKEEVPARIFPAPEHGNLKNISFEGIPSEEVRNYLKEHSWRYSRRNRAWYPGTKEAQASNEEFVKNFLQKFYPNTLSEEQIPQTLFDTIPEERETEAIPESDVNNPHSDFPDVDNQDMAEPDVDHQNAAEPVPESSNQEQSSPEAIAPKTEYTFTPTVGEDGIIDYTGVEVDKIRLPNKTQILNQFLPSYLPPVEIRREGRYDIPAVKVADNQYLLKGTKKGGPIYRVSLDVYAALVDYHLKYDRAARKAIADYNNNVLKEALENEQAEFFPLRTKLPSIPEPLSFESHCQPERKRVSSRYQYSPGRVAFQQSSSHRMTSEVYYFIESEIGSGNSNIFSHHQKNLEELQQKMLDMELQHSDLESTWTKGRETAYGDTNLDESLLATYGVNIKRQNGNTLSAHEKTELKEVLNQVYSTYGDLSSITKDYGLKISHSGTTRMHASKAVGLFTPGMKALGISFGLGKDEAIYTAVHEMAHFIDHVRGQEKHAWHASDIPGTLENRIATTFRKGMNNAKGDYWNRTCECFARAMEEYGKIVHIQQKHPDWDSEKINEKVSLPAYMDYTKFYSTMIPLIQEWIETTRNEMKIDEWSLPNSLDQKNIENDKITKSQSKGFRESTPQRQENPTFKKFESLIESAKADIHPIRMKSIKKTLDLISQKINEGNPQITQLISDFDPVQENHVMAGMTTKKAYAYDIMYKLLPQCNAIIQEERKQAFEQDKVPYIHLEWSESPIFPFENSYYSIKEFNELIENEDRRFYNERERIIQKYGSYEKYYAIPKEELPIEDRNVSLGYDKTKFQILNLPTMDKTDTISYGADRYDIGDGYGSIFDFVRETCTYPQVIEALNNLENELYFPSVSQEQKDKVQTIIEGNKKSLEKSLSNHLNLYHEVRMQEEQQRKSILVDITKTNLLKEQKKNALQNIKDSYDHSIASILGEAKSMDIPKEYAINETKKFVTGMLYTPPSSWNEMGEIWSLFPATCNFTETLQELYEQQTKVQPVREERTQDSLAIEIASNEKQLPENESPIEYPVGKYGQLELFAFEQTPSYNNSMKAVSQYITSGDPSLTKEHIWRAKAATRTYCNPILDGKKSGLWKNFRDFKKHGVLDILGANAEMEQGKITPQGWNQLATALQIYRDKRFETFRYLFVSPEGKIQDQLAVCSHLPGKTLSNLPSENLLGQVITHAEETGTKVVLVHNHPSGNITPSVDDIRMTKKTEAAFTRSDGKCLLAGHIILDHDSYSLYQKGKEWEARMLSPYDIYDPLLKTRNPLEAITVSGPESLELVAQAVNSHDKWKEEGWVPVVFTNSGSQISAVKMYPEDFLTQNNAKLLNQLQETAKRTGAVMAFPIILDKNHISQENQKNLLDRMKAGCFTDFYLGEKDGSFRTSEDFNLIPGKNLFDEVGMEQMAEQTNITSTFPRHQKYEMESLGLFVAEEKKEYESFLGQIDDYLKRGKLPEYNRFILTQTPLILEFTGIPQNHVLLSTGVLNKARKIHGLDNKEIMDSVKGLFNPMLVFSSDKSTSEAKNDSILVITEATARNGKPLTLALELNKEMSSHRQSYVVNDIRSIHDRSIVAQNGVDILKKWTEKGLLRYYDDKKISDWLELRRVQFPLSLTKSDMSMIADKNTSVKTRSQFENSMMKKIYQSDLPEKLLTPAQIRERKQELPVKHSFMVNNSFIPPMELAKNGPVQIYCSSEDLQNPISQNSQEIKPVVLEMTPKQAAVLVDASIKKQSMENRLSKQQLPLNLPAKSKMEESFFTGLKNVHPQLTRKEAERQYHEVYSMIEKELKDLRIAPAIERKTPQRKDFSMEW